MFNKPGRTLGKCQLWEITIDEGKFSRRASIEGEKVAFRCAQYPSGLETSARSIAGGKARNELAQKLGCVGCIFSQLSPDAAAEITSPGSPEPSVATPEGKAVA